jgi:phosphohistidine phosphatase
LLYLVHHGDAVGPEVDSARPLSTRGRADVDNLAQKAAERGAKPSLVWHSGKLRAKQTAEAFWRRCNPFARFVAARGLQPDDPPNWILEAVQFAWAVEDSPDTENNAPISTAPAPDIMLVGHFPHLPRLLGLLLTGSDETAAEFPKNGVVALSESDGKWTEEWRLRPD